MTTRKYPGRDDAVDELLELEKRLSSVERRLTVVNEHYSSYPTTEYTTPPMSVTLGTYTSLYRVEGIRRNRRIFFKLRVQTPAATTATVRIQDNVNNWTLFSSTVPVGVTVDVVTADAGVDFPPQVTFGSRFAFDVEALRSSGSGTVRVGLALTYGV